MLFLIVDSVVKLQLLEHAPVQLGENISMKWDRQMYGLRYGAGWIWCDLNVSSSDDIANFLNNPLFQLIQSQKKSCICWL